MPKTARFKPNPVKDGQKIVGYRINIPASISASGKRQRFFFPTRAEAREESKRLSERYKESGAQASPVPPSLADSARRCADRLAEYGHTLESATNAFLQILDAKGASKSLQDAGEVWLETKSGKLREDSLKSYRYTLQRLEPLAERLMCDLTANEVEEAIAAKATSFDMHLRNAKAFFRFCEKKGWCRDDVLKSVESRGAFRGDIETLTPTQARKVMETAEKYFPDAVAAFAISLFAGLRAKELERLVWADVKADGIEVQKATSKKNIRRFVTMNPTLAAWLKGQRLADGEAIVPANWREKFDGVRRLAGFRLSARILDKVKPVGARVWPPRLPKNATEWPQNALRRTHATAAIASGKTVDDLIFEFGHTGGSEMLLSHYVGVYRPREAVAFWSIGPRGTKIETIRAA